MNSSKHSGVLIIGGLGFLGSHLAVKLSRLGFPVTLLDSRRISEPERPVLAGLQSESIQIVDGDYLDSATLSDLLPGTGLIYVLAGQVSHQRSMQQPLLDLDLNCRAVLQLLELCRSCQLAPRIVFAGTRQVYGRQVVQPVDEQRLCEPLDVNAVSKLAAEHFLRLYHHNYHIPAVSLRLTNIYGPAMDLLSPDRGVLNQIIGNALRLQPVVLYEGGRLLRDLLYIDDATEALYLAGTASCATGNALNVSGTDCVSLGRIVDSLRQFIPVTVEDRDFPEELRSTDLGDYHGDSTRFRRLTGWTPAWSLTDGLRETILFFRQNPEFLHLECLSSGSRASQP